MPPVQPINSPTLRHYRKRGLSIAALAVALSLAPAAFGQGAFGQEAFGQEASGPASAATSAVGDAGRAAKAAAAETSVRLPAPVSVSRQLAVAGQPLRYVTTAGSIPLRDADGALEAEVAYLAYVKEPDTAAGANPSGKRPATRPVTFVFNGGPGAASAWLNFGGLGPRIITFGNEGNAPSDVPALRDNPETWLAFTDLVFIDPPGTGFSRLASSKDALRKRFWSVDGDIQGLARVVSRYLVEQGRLASPKYLVGESYGGFRVPKLASALQTREGVGVNGVVMLSPVLDFARLGPHSDPVIAQAALLPAMAAARLERDGALTQEAIAEVEEYARGPYVTDLLRGPADAEAQGRIVAKVAEFTGLDPALVARLGGRIDARTFAREFRRDGGEVVSQYDAGVGGPDPFPFTLAGRNDDPILEGAQAPLASAAVDEITREIGWKPEGRYTLLSEDVNRGWDWGRGLRPPEALGDLRAALALDPKMKSLVAHGYNDLVTPYFQSTFDLASLPPLGRAGRTALRVYPGGHMFYTRQSSRRSFLDDVRALYAGAQAEPAGGKSPARQ